MNYLLSGGRIELPAAAGTAPATVAQAFARSVTAFRGNAAIEPLQGPSVTYAELATQVARAATALQRLGLSQGDSLAICLPNRVEWAVFTYAAALLGACVVPVNIRFRADELAFVLRGSGAKVLVTQSSFMTNDFLSRLRQIGEGVLGQADIAAIPALPQLTRILLVDGAVEAGTLDYPGFAQDLPSADIEQLAAQRRPEEPLWLFWTSGTTSAPKGALLPQSSIEMIWRWTMIAGYAEHDRVLTARPFFYIAGHFWTLIGPMLYGAASIISDELSSAQMQSLCKRQRVTVLNGNPLMMKDLIDQDTFDPSAFEHVRLGHFGGSGLPADELARIQRILGYDHLLQTYGMTEFAGFVLTTLPDDSIEVAAQSCGYPFTDVELRIADPETGMAVADGEVGMLLTRGQKLMRYLNLDETARTALFDAEGWYRTGDLMRRLPDGRYQFVGRQKDLIKVNGENVTAAEVESLLMKHPGVNLASVVAAADTGRGEVPVAYVELRPSSSSLSMAELKTWCRDRMAPYKVPARLYRVTPERWPKTVSGKIAKHQLNPGISLPE